MFHHRLEYIAGSFIELVRHDVSCYHSWELALRFRSEKKGIVNNQMATAWYTYLVRCADGSLYAGATNDLARRLAAHNSGKGARYTRSRRPVELAWSKRSANKSRALSLEALVKKLTRLEKHALVLGAKPPRLT